MDVVKNLTDYLGEKGIKQAHVADKCGWNRQKMNSICSGNQRVSMDDYIKICDALNLPYEFFFRKTEDAG